MGPTSLRWTSILYDIVWYCHCHILSIQVLSSIVRLTDKISHRLGMIGNIWGSYLPLGGLVVRYGALGVMNDFRGVTSAYGYGDSYLVTWTHGGRFDLEMVEFVGWFSLENSEENEEPRKWDNMYIMWYHVNVIPSWMLTLWPLWQH